MYDLVVVGGGLAGASVALAMVQRGAHVVVLERETRFRDRVRGESMSPWGVAEAKRLGVDRLMVEAGGRELRYWTSHFGHGEQRRDLVETTPQRLPLVTFSHPAMQEALLEAAAARGADVRRGVVVRSIAPGQPPRVTVELGGTTEELTAQLVVGADGRASAARRWAGFDVREDPPLLRITGVLIETRGVPTDTVSFFGAQSRATLLFPLEGNLVRMYLAWHSGVLDERFAGEAAFGRLGEESIASGMPASIYEGARVLGPLATFEGAAAWAPFPYKDGVVLVGDAAATSDPSWGQGISLTLRDVRVLTDELAQNDDWDTACRAYAAAHDRYHQTLHTAETWFADLLFAPGPEGEARRGRVFMAVVEDPSRMPDVFQSGPDMTLDDAGRRRLFNE